MAYFASYRRSGLVRILVLILCVLFIFATLGAPPAQALGVESVAVFGLASVLSAATAALGFKLSSDEQGQATLQKMVQDFKTVAWATGFVLVGSKLNGLQNGMDYIKMQVQNGKTYLDARVFAWVQKWLAENGVYEAGSSSIEFEEYVIGSFYDVQLVSGITLSQFLSLYGCDSSQLPASAKDYYIDPYTIVNLRFDSDGSFGPIYIWKFSNTLDLKHLKYGSVNQLSSRVLGFEVQASSLNVVSEYWYIYGNSMNHDYQDQIGNSAKIIAPRQSGSPWDYCVSNAGTLVNSGNDTGLSGTDTLGKDVVDLTLDQILEKLKEWAQDWYDAGADSATNAAVSAKDLPLTVATGAATANPSIAEDGPLVWFPPFSVPIPNLRTGETDTKTVDQGKENASSVETSTDVAENQSVIDSLVNWALNYISPDTGLFSKFPLCVPYDAYLLVTSSLGVDAVGSDSIFGASPGDLEGVVTQDIETYSDFQPIINIKHDFELDGKTYPVELTIDLTPWQPLVTFFREGMALLLVAELIGSEFKRIRGH